MKDEKITINLSQENLQKERHDSTNEDMESKKVKKRNMIFLIGGIFGIIAGGVMIALPFLLPKEVKEALTYPTIPSQTASSEKTYSSLTGMELANASDKTAPAYCIQTPNGTDGARPHSGLTDAGVVFEAIAEAGITRFAAIYQNPTQAIIGPLRSLRIYFLDWDVPFDCTVVHAGGSADAIDSLRAGGYKDLSEDYDYMYRGTYGNRLWNNLFTTSSYLKKFSADHNYNTSNIQGFTRMTPEQSKKNRIDTTASEKLDITKASDKNLSEMAPKTAHIKIDFGGWDAFDVVYDYDANTNTYNRSYGNGDPHSVYVCSTEDLGERNPEDVCTLSQMSPAVVIAMMVQESRAADNYHEAITTMGSGDAYIFQNGIAIKGTWNKSSREAQIEFKDASGATIELAPGQTFISAVPNYGSVVY